MTKIKNIKRVEKTDKKRGKRINTGICYAHTRETHRPKYCEHRVEEALVKAVTRAGGLALKYYNTASAGWPDRIVVMPNGVLVWVELKATGQKPRELQLIRHEQLRELGQLVSVVDTPQDAEALVWELQNIMVD